MTSNDSFLDPHAPVSRHGRFLHHRQQGAILYFVTWRLADSIPREWKMMRSAWGRLHMSPWYAAVTAATRRELDGEFTDIDTREGEALLRDPQYSRLVAGSLHRFDGESYDLDSFVVMPNHVHALWRLRPGRRLESVVGSVKRHSSWMVNRKAERSGHLWLRGYWDRMIRDAGHLERVRAYIRRNPERAGLAEWEFVHYQATS